MGVNWKNDAYEYARDIFKTTGVPFGTQQALQDPNSLINQPSDVAGWVNLGTSIFFSVTNMYINSRDNDEESTADSKIADQIQSDLKAIFDKYPGQGINDLDSLEAYYENQKLEKIGLEKTIANNTELINNLSNRNTTLTGQINSLEQDINRLKSDCTYHGGEIPEEIQRVIDHKLSEVNNLKAELTENEETIRSKQGENETATVELNKINLEAIEQDINNVKALMRQLKNASGETAIEDLVNEDTDNFSKKIQDLIRAIRTGDKENIGQAARDVKVAYNAYKVKYGEENIPSQIEKGWEQAKKYLPEE